MARSLYQALTRITPFLTHSTTTSKAPLPRFLTARNRSTLPDIPINNLGFDFESYSDVERAALRKLEDAVHRIIVKRSQPGWLPFRPGSSYWVPPQTKARGVAEVISRLADTAPPKEPAMVIASNRGWPSSDYFNKGAASSTREVETSSKKTTQSEDEES